MANPGTSLSKTVLRREMRHRLRGVEPDSAAVRQAIGRWLEIHPEARTLAAFAALSGEPDLLPLVAAHPERTWVFPTVRGETLSFHVIADVARELAYGSFGIREPRGGLADFPVEKVDAFFCPGLAFTQKGGRLGRGRGFYDRMLALARPGAVKLGVCIGPQMVDDVFAEPHDVTMDEVLTGG